MSSGALENVTAPTGRMGPPSPERSLLANHEPGAAPGRPGGVADVRREAGAQPRELDPEVVVAVEVELQQRVELVLGAVGREVAVAHRHLAVREGGRRAA